MIAPCGIEIKVGQVWLSPSLHQCEVTGFRIEPYTQQQMVSLRWPDKSRMALSLEMFNDKRGGYKLVSEGDKA